MSISPATLRQRAASALEALSGWSEVPYAWDLYQVRELPEIRHQGFAVGVPATVVQQPDARHRTDRGVLCRTDLAVRFAYILRDGGHVVDTDAAVTAELAAIAAVRGMTTTDADPPRLERVDRTTTTNDSIAARVIDLRFTVLHLYALA